MAGEALFVGWGNAVRGREAKSLQVFQEAVEYYGGQQQQGNIDSFEPVFLQPHGGDLAGFFLVKGDAEKIDAMRRSDEFQRIHTRANQIVEGLGIVSALTGEALANAMGMFQEASAELGG
jgi:hypothetical protein